MKQELYAAYWELIKADIKEKEIANVEERIPTPSPEREAIKAIIRTLLPGPENQLAFSMYAQPRLHGFCNKCEAPMGDKDCP